MISIEKITVIPPTKGVGAVCIFLLLGMSRREGGRSALYRNRPTIILNSNDKKAARQILKLKLSKCVNANNCKFMNIYRILLYLLITISY